MNIANEPGVRIVTYNALRPNLFKVWYERYWDFPTREEAIDFAEKFHVKKQAECDSYGFAGVATVVVYVPAEPGETPQAYI